MADDVQRGTGRPPVVVSLIFAVLLVGIVVAARYFYLVQRDRVVQSRVLMIEGTALIQRERIEAWLRNRREDAQLTALACGRFLLPAGSRAKAAIDAARAWARAELQVRGYVGIHLLDRAGDLVIAEEAAERSDPAMVRRVARQAVLSGSPVVSDELDASGRMHIYAAAPVKTADGRGPIVGAAVLHLDPEPTLFRLFLSQTGPSLSWEAILLFVPHRRCVWLRRPGPPPAGDVAAVPMPPRDTVLAKTLSGQLGHFEGTDEYGRRFLAQVQPLHQAGWVLVGRERITETDKLVHVFAVPYVTAVVALIAAAFALLAYIWQWYAATALRQTLEAEKRERKAQHDLAESRALLQTILDAVPQRIFWKDRESRYLGCNLPFARDAGCQGPADLIGKDDYAMSWHRNADLYRSDDREVIESGVPKIGYEEPQDRPDGERRWLRTSKVPLRREDGTIEGVLGTYEDITEQVKTRQALEEARDALEEKNRELSQLLYLISHDLRSPLVTVQGFAQELKVSVEELLQLVKSEALPEGVKERVDYLSTNYIPRCIRYVNQSARAMDRLLQGILHMSRLDRSELRKERVDMGALTSAVVEAFAEDARRVGATITVESLPPCYGDAAMLERVLRNLLSNALKFLARDRAGAIRISGRVEDGFAVYCVEDNGIGIPEEAQKRVFEMFYRAAPDYAEGEGLGLASVKLLVGKHGGRCWIESLPLEWTRVYFTISTNAEESGSRGGMEP